MLSDIVRAQQEVRREHYQEDDQSTRQTEESRENDVTQPTKKPENVAIAAENSTKINDEL